MFDFNKTARLIKGALFEPQPNWQAYLPKSNDWKQTAKDLTVPLIVGALILSFILSLVFGSFPRPGLGLGGLILGLVVGFTGFLVAAYILAWMARVFKGSNDFNRAFAALSLTTVPTYAGMVLSSLPWIGWLLSLGLLVYSLVLLYRIIPDYLAVPEGSRVTHFICSLLAMFVVMLVLASLFGVGMMGAYAGSIQ